MFETPVIIAILATFLLAGAVKGVIGLGLPTVSLALLTVATDLTSAMALLLVPSLAMATLTVWLGALALTRVDLALLSALLGALLVVYAALSLAGLRLAVPPAREAWLGALAGAVNGILTGMTGSFVVPGVLYLQALGLGRDALIQAMGLLFTLSTLALAAALGGSGLLSPDLGLWSAAAVAPALLGMVLGQKVRRALPEARFRRVFFAALLVLGTYIVAGALGAAV
jgi:uncharacterized membrane protein YfcA